MQSKCHKKKSTPVGVLFFLVVPVGNFRSPASSVLRSLPADRRTGSGGNSHFGVQILRGLFGGDDRFLGEIERSGGYQGAGSDGGDVEQPDW